MEIEDYISSYNRVKKQQVKEQVSWQHAVICLLDERMSAFCGNKVEFTMPWDRYPDLFEEEKKLYEQKAAERKLSEMGESRRNYAAEFNRRRR